MGGQGAGALGPGGIGNINIFMAGGRFFCAVPLCRPFVSAFATLFLPRFPVSVGSHIAALELMIPWLSPEC